MEPLQVGNYEVGEELGRGAFGQIHKAYSLGRDPVRICAAKKLSAELDHQMNEAVGELNTLENLPNHKHIAQLIEHEEVFTPSHCIWLFLEFCEGGTLGDYVFRNPRNVDAKRQLTIQLADAVAFLHSQHIVHRDLKPQNLMIKDRTEFPILKVVDFGLATVCTHLDRARVHDYFTGSVIGTPYYVAPEVQPGNHQNFTTAVDIFSMGLVIWAMFDNLNATTNADQEPYLAPYVRSPTTGYPEAIGQVLRRGGTVDQDNVMRNHPNRVRRNLVLSMIAADYNRRPPADTVFNNLMVIEDESDQDLSHQLSNNVVRNYSTIIDADYNRRPTADAVFTNLMVNRIEDESNQDVTYQLSDTSPIVATTQDERETNSHCRTFSTILLVLLYCLVQLLKAVVLVIITIPFVLALILQAFLAPHFFLLYMCSKCCSDFECIVYIVKFKMVPPAFEFYKNICSDVVNFQKSFPPCE